MTFAVIDVGGESQKVVGTIWASEESEAQTMASGLFTAQEQQTVVLRHFEERELPLPRFD